MNNYEILEQVEDAVWNLGDDKVCVYEISKDVDIEINVLLDLIRTSRRIRIFVTMEAINLRRVERYTLESIAVNDFPNTSSTLSIDFKLQDGKPDYGFRCDLQSKSPLHVLEALETIAQNLRETVEYGRIV